MQQLILASGSRYRQNQLSALGLRYRAVPAEIDESTLALESPKACAERLALYKAQAVAKHFADALVIGCDQTGDLNGLVLGKPGDHAAATAQLKSMSGQTVVFHSAVVLVGAEQIWRDCVSTHVLMRTLSDHDIDRYLHRDQPYDCAGSFKIEGAGSLLMNAVHSDDPSALIGLPLIALANLLRQAGLDPLQ